MQRCTPPPLVLGASGRIGRALRHHWGAEAALWQTRRPQAGAGWHVFDPLSEPSVLQRIVGDAGQVLCLAGPLPAPGVNLRDHLKLAEACVLAAAATGARVVLASSAAVYGSQPGPLDENVTPAPMSPYGQAKADMERAALALGRDMGVAVTCLRIGNIAGFDAILGGWRPGFSLDQFANGSTPRRSYIGVLTLADVIAAVLAAPERPELLNIAQPGPIQMGALLDAAGRDYVGCPAPQTAIPEVALDVARLRAFLAPQMTLSAADPAGMIAEMALLEPHMKDSSAQ
ncbi:NAD-dependent epimerase/dehydratase family protein [Tritonibacter scottomollicae]|uniref:NAD-dependent epimerase/dehydratase family protein n=1 Tax=Tritonibacter scottomollicae TaxID=483013 RepID=UPI003AA9423A